MAGETIVRPVRENDRAAWEPLWHPYLALLVTTLVTVSVNERAGEIAVMRAIGVSRSHVVEQIVAESALFTGNRVRILRDGAETFPVSTRHAQGSHDHAARWGCCSCCTSASETIQSRKALILRRRIASGG